MGREKIGFSNQMVVKYTYDKKGDRGQSDSAG